MCRWLAYTGTPILLEELLYKPVHYALTPTAPACRQSNDRHAVFRGIGSVNVSELLIETFDRLPRLVRSAVRGLSPEELRWAPAPGANSIGWLVWHLTRVQDDHVADLLGEEQLWAGGDWAGRLGLDADPSNTGYGHSTEQVAAVRPDSPTVLVDYYDAVAARTGDMLRGLTEADLDRVVDTSWDPPVTLGVRLVSIANDDLQHVGQAAYVRGLLPGR